MSATTNTSQIQASEKRLAGIKPTLVKGQNSSRDQVEKKARYVLIVDDQSTGRIILEQIIHTIDGSLRVISFSNPHEALTQCMEETPDLILTDYRMPRMNGVEFIKRVRAAHSCKDVPVMMITIVSDRSVRHEALNAGATDFLTRPVDHHEFKTRCRNMLNIRKQQCVINDRIKWLQKQVENSSRQILQREHKILLRLVKAGKFRDKHTGNHTLRIGKYSRLIAEQLGLSMAYSEDIERAAPMHDIGKIGVPDHILLNSGKLAHEEMSAMQLHTVIGQSILKDSESRFIELSAVIALCHHEKYDGSGYPNGLVGEEIPLPARIVAVADVYDALRSCRPYKEAWSRKDTIAYIQEQSGKHFDPACVNAFIDKLDLVEEYEQRLIDLEDDNQE